MGIEGSGEERDGLHCVAPVEKWGSHTEGRDRC